MFSWKGRYSFISKQNIIRTEVVHFPNRSIYAIVSIAKKIIVILSFKNSIFSNNIFNVTWKVSVFGVFLVRIFPHSDWIRRDRYFVSLRIWSKCGKMRTIKIPNADTFPAVDLYLDPSWISTMNLLFVEIVTAKNPPS